VFVFLAFREVNQTLLTLFRPLRGPKITQKPSPGGHLGLSIWSGLGRLFPSCQAKNPLPKRLESVFVYLGQTAAMMLPSASLFEAATRAAHPKTISDEAKPDVGRVIRTKASGNLAVPRLTRVFNTVRSPDGDHSTFASALDFHPSDQRARSFELQESK